MNADGLPPLHGDPGGFEPKLSAAQGALRAPRPRPARFNGRIAALLAGGAAVFVVGAIFVPSLIPKHPKDAGKSQPTGSPTPIAPIQPISYAGPGGADGPMTPPAELAGQVPGPAAGVDCSQYPGMPGCGGVNAAAAVSAPAAPAPAVGPAASGAQASPLQGAPTLPGANSAEAARTSGLFFGGVLGGAGNALASRTPAGQAPVAAQAPAPLPGSPGGPSFAVPAKEPGDVMAQNGQGEKAAFARQAVSRDYVAGKLEKPRSPYEVKAGAVIPAALMTTINSDLPGDVVAQVTQPVYDHVTGRYVLIPQGSRLIGRYDSQVAYGQNRAMVVWRRVVFPNGDSLNFGTMTGTDPTGASGIGDRVDDHFGQLARGIVLSTLLSMGAASAQDSQARSSGAAVINAGATGVATEAQNVGSRIADRDMNRQPTIVIRAGAQMRVLVSKDMVLEPYAS
ncbi:MAG TPA: TrbI/VirB10 family protein [Caulobacteraceae bacterium]|jgi:type IV secretion system protein VirB10|nr:TrbI/VirB10 family protein [Caulobacteraceae bacterium]